ncbi:MAG: YciI family protein [Chloroflexota bacterium]
MLYRAPEPPAVSEAEAARIQRRHLSFLEAMHARGVMLAAGPFRDQPDQRWRGLCVYLVPPDEARALAEQDPAVVAGRLSFEVIEWLTPQGQLGSGRRELPG